MLTGPTLYAQKNTRKQLEAKKVRLQKEIKKANKLLFNTQKEEENALNDLKDLDQNHFYIKFIIIFTCFFTK